MFVCRRGNRIAASLLRCARPLLALSGHIEASVRMSASLIGRLGSSAFRLSTNSSVDVAHGLSLLFGLGTKGPSIMGFEDEVEQSFGRPCRQCDGRFKRTYELTSSIVPRGTSFHRGVELDFLLLHWILHSSQATATSLVHRNSVPSTHTRCMITAN